MIEIIFLGTACMFPTKERGHSGLIIRDEGDYLLFDCGEGTQRQIRIAGISPHKISKIFITHWHGDHCLGLPGLFESLTSMGKKQKIELYGLDNPKKHLDNFFSAINLNPCFEISTQSINLSLYQE